MSAAAVIAQMQVLEAQHAAMGSQIDALKRELVALASTEPKAPLMEPVTGGRPGRGGRPYVNGDTRDGT